MSFVRSFAAAPMSAVLFAMAVAPIALSTAAADEAAIRTQAVVNFTFDEESGPALDSASGGSVKDNGALQNGIARVKSPFWSQGAGKALVLDSGARQFVQIADGPDVDRSEAVSFSLFFANLHAATDNAFHGVVAKRDDAKQITNYGMNYAANNDTLQLYINDGGGYKAATYSLNGAVGYRRPAYITAVFEVGDAPPPDADEDKDDMLIRLYVNGQPVKPKGASGGTVAGNDVWLADIKVANLLNDTPLTLGSSTPAIEFTSCLIDEFSLFPRALSGDEVARLFTEVAGANVQAQIADEARPIPAGPEISSLSPSGLARGQSTVLAITGTNLLPDPVLVSPAPITRQVVRPGATAERIELELTVAATAPAGHFPVRVETPRGISGALTVAVDSLPQIPFAESSPDKPIALPVAISGTIAGPQQAKVHFPGKAGQHLVIDLECKRLGSAMEPVLELRNPRGAPLSIAWGRPQYRGDVRIEANLFSDGVYSVELHDLTYKAPGQNSYRLKIGDLKMIDTVFPPAVASGSQRSVSAIGPGMDPTATLAVDMHDQVPGLVKSISLPAETGTVGPAPSVIASGAVELLEEPQPDGKPQVIDAQFPEKAHIPLVVNGRISRHGEIDRYVLNVKPGTTLNLAVESYAFHSPLDPQIIVLSHPEGARLAVSEERPSLDYAVLAGISAIQIAVQDVNHRGGPEFVYRLRIVPAGHPDFSLTVASERVAFPRDGTALLRVDATRAGYDGPIALALVGAPELSLAPAEIPAGVSKAFVTLAVKSGQAAEPLAIKHMRLIGTSAGLEPALARIAQIPLDNRLELVPGARSELTAAIISQPTAIVELGHLPPVWFRGADTEIPVAVKAQNADLARLAVRWTLLTTESARTQVDPTDPTQQRRITLPMLRSLPEQSLPPGEVAGALRVAVPLEVVEGQIDCVVRADFVPNIFSDRVLATAYSPPFRLPVQNAVSVELAAKSLTLTGNMQATFAGAVKRTARFEGPVDVSLLNLPGGYSASKVTVAADQEKFEIVVTAPAVTAAADLPNIQFRVASPAGSLLQKDTPIPTKVMPGQ